MDSQHVCDLLSNKTKTTLARGFFLVNGFLQYNVKIDDFINIISRYLIEISIQFGDDVKKIVINGNHEVSDIGIFNNKLFVVVSRKTKHM